MHRRVVPAQDHLDALQPHHAIGLEPPAIVADRHSDNATERAPDGEAQVADIAVSLLEILERIGRFVIAMSGKVDLPVLADDAAFAIDDGSRC